MYLCTCVCALVALKCVCLVTAAEVQVTMLGASHSHAHSYFCTFSTQNMLGATETSHGMAWATLVVLACRPDVQEKIREEQAALITSSGREVTWEALQNGMPYTDACVREVSVV